MSPLLTQSGHRASLNDPHLTRYDALSGASAHTMRRRDFLALVVGTSACWPLVVCAQQSERVRRISVLAGGGLVADDLDLRARSGAFEDGLIQLGLINGQNLRIDIRAGAGDVDRIRRTAEELVALAPDVILATGASAVAP